MADASHLPVLLLALALDALFGEPAWLYARIPHPVVLFGRLIGWLDRKLNRAQRSFEERRMRGVLAVAFLAAVAVLPALWLDRLLHALPLGWAAEALLASTLIAQRSLHDHVAAVAAGLEDAGLRGGRRAVAMIVGRDPDSLDEAGVARAAIESCAENFSDGVVAPVLWFALLGLPGLALYKAVNTADSMIGHRTPRHEAFGWAAARLDDLMNLVPARLAGALLALAALATRGRAAAETALAAMRADAGHHRSPNAGWPEAAMAGALGVALAGPRRYAGVLVEDRWMHAAGNRDAAPGDIRAALALMRAACWTQAGLASILWIMS
ncbi:adenosylcobinamide-phosphate synthase CbiB [Arenibaculum pallidiluteum]|uniref:adenosylcobinamide-phosphate synthase CbiB n=1 Tax=Arenibaculum pallidiluteum TaxID=2812559 RepID=UPI001A9656BB|nr:adenosylcobinamide-phosphate synthase CbiB [Arenibaculum pallidiluteum]